jgi:hypothetical protein
VNNDLDVREGDLVLLAGVIDAYLPGEDTRSPSRDSNTPLPDTKSEALPFESTCPVSASNQKIVVGQCPGPFISGSHSHILFHSFKII